MFISVPFCIFKGQRYFEDTFIADMTDSLSDLAVLHGRVSPQWMTNDKRHFFDRWKVQIRRLQRLEVTLLTSNISQKEASYRILTGPCCLNTNWLQENLWIQTFEHSTAFAVSVCVSVCVFAVMTELRFFSKKAKEKTKEKATLLLANTWYIFPTEKSPDCCYTLVISWEMQLI